MNIDPNLAISLQRAEELLICLRAEYDIALERQDVSERAAQLTHEVLERLRSVLDRVARRYWRINVASDLSEEDQQRASVYFPITSGTHDFDSIMGRWRWKGVRDKHLPICKYLLHLQPFHDGNNDWLRILNELAVQGKHIDLVPQTRTEQRQISVKNNSGSQAVWNPAGVRFGPGVRVAGAPIDPATQRIVPTPGVTEHIQVWVSFVLDGYDLNALGFCDSAVKRTRGIVEEMSIRFGL